jgi:hypothetical protein
MPSTNSIHTMMDYPLTLTALLEHGRVPGSDSPCFQRFTTGKINSLSGPEYLLIFSVPVIEFWLRFSP